MAEIDSGDHCYAMWPRRMEGGEHEKAESNYPPSTVSRPHCFIHPSVLEGVYFFFRYFFPRKSARDSIPWRTDIANFPRLRENCISVTITVYRRCRSSFNVVHRVRRVSVKLFLNRTVIHDEREIEQQEQI